MSKFKLNKMSKEEIEKNKVSSYMVYPTRVIHITQDSLDGYEVVDLLADKVSKTNSLSVIRKNGQNYFTGGLFVTYSEELVGVLRQMPKSKQYEFLKSIRVKPRAYNEHWEKQQSTQETTSIPSVPREQRANLDRECLKQKEEKKPWWKK